MPLPPEQRRQIRVVGALIEKPGPRYLITQRRPTATLPLLWEFPGGRVEEGETDQDALSRELKQEMDIDVAVLEPVMHTHHEYPKYDIDFRVYRCVLLTPEQQIHHLAVHDHRWVALHEMSEYRFPDADAKTLEKLLGLA
jgi:8-oxo-dGTP diphosphatase